MATAAEMFFESRATLCACLRPGAPGLALFETRESVIDHRSSVLAITARGNHRVYRIGMPWGPRFALPLGYLGWRRAPSQKGLWS